MKTILITGGFGILGASLSNILYNKGYKIIIFDRSKKRKKLLNTYINSKIIRQHGDFTNIKQVKTIIRKNKINTIIHLGAITQVIEAYKEPYRAFKNNVTGTINILEAVREVNKKINIIFSSSDKAYGKMTKKSYTESNPLHGDYPYDVSKSAADLISQSYSKTYNLKIGIIRSGNIYGPADINMDRLIPGTIVKALKGEPVQIRTSGKLVRDYLFVDDVSNAYYKLLLYMNKNNNKKLFIYNLGSKFNFNSLEVVKRIYKIININLKPIILNKSSIEIIAQKLNYKKAVKDLKWKPITDFKIGMLKTIKWYKDNYNEFKHLKF
ncbi:SDR family NAD(P)-dependent oxidoreductase [Candidatus Pelagibacter ubique]|nr:SDR family NAD(P)-dependent oxidoreductase [Candidatus Pelagibacter ubique]